MRSSKNSQNELIRDGKGNNRLQRSLSMGHRIQIITYNQVSDAIDVVTYTATFAQNVASNTYTYNYMLWSPTTEVISMPILFHFFHVKFHHIIIRLFFNPSSHTRTSPSNFKDFHRIILGIESIISFVVIKIKLSQRAQNTAVSILELSPIDSSRSPTKKNS